jgi:adenylate kinase
MRVAVTGTPGTGKTTAVEAMDTDLPVVHMNELVREEGLTTGRDEARDSLVVDLEAVRERLAGRETLLVESHLAHLLDVDLVVVLRCHPDELRERLRERGEQSATVDENLESEALDVVLAEAVDGHGDDVHEIDTTGRRPGAVARDRAAVGAGEASPGGGGVDFGDTLEP